jgi:SpoU rRNA Methylase family
MWFNTPAGVATGLSSAVSARLRPIVGGYFAPFALVVHSPIAAAGAACRHVRRRAPRRAGRPLGQPPIRPFPFAPPSVKASAVAPFAPPLRLALFEPDIAENAGSMLRTCACFGVSAAIIEPQGFAVSDRHFRRAGMDYLAHVQIDRHASCRAFSQW